MNTTIAGTVTIQAQQSMPPQAMTRLKNQVSESD